jgi:putative membrane protein
MRDPAAAFAWQPQPDTWLLIVALAGGYLYALSALGPRLAPGRKPATTTQKWLFFAGVGVLWVAADWPIHGLAEDYLYSVHMVQHLLFQLVAGPLLLLGTPAWLLRRLLRPRWLEAIWRTLTQPLIALLFVSGFTAAIHVPAVVNLTATNGWAHVGLHVLLVGSSFVMWWPVLSPLPELPHLSYPGRMAYLFGHSILPTVPASFLTFADSPLYEAYALAPRLAPWLDAAQDQQIAGLLMKIGGGLFIWAVIAVLFFRWSSEESSGGPDPLYWRDLEPDVEEARASQVP